MLSFFLSLLLTSASRNLLLFWLPHVSRIFWVFSVLLLSFILACQVVFQDKHLQNSYFLNLILTQSCSSVNADYKDTVWLVYNLLVPSASRGSQRHFFFPRLFLLDVVYIFWIISSALYSYEFFFDFYFSCPNRFLCIKDTWLGFMVLEMDACLALKLIPCHTSGKDCNFSVCLK